MKIMLAAFAAAFALVFAPALAADANDESDDHAQLEADVARLEGKIDTLTKTVVSSVGRVTDNVGSLTTKVDDFTARGEVAVFFGAHGDSGLLHSAGGNIAGATVSAVPGGSGIRLPAGTYEVTVLQNGGSALEMHDGRRFQPLSLAPVGGPAHWSHGVVSAVAAAVYSFHYAPSEPPVARAGARPPTLAGTRRGVIVPRLGTVVIRRL